MIALVLVGMVFDRRVNLLRMLGFSAIVLLLFNPHQLFDIGFQLSYVAVIFLVLFAGPLSAGLARCLPGWDAPTASWWKRGAATMIFPLLTASFVAWMATAPIMAACFQWFCPITLLANLLIVGWVSFFTIPLGFVSLLAGSVWLPLVYPLNAVNAKLTELLIVLTRYLADIPWGNFSVASPGGWTLFWYYAFFALMAWVIAKKSAGGAPLAPGSFLFRHRRMLLGLMAGLAVAGEVAFQHRLECVFFDVGQGDAIFIRFPNGKTMLVDSGTGWLRDTHEPFDRMLRGYMRTIGAKQIDYLVLSHLHADHIGGAPGVLKNIKVGELVTSGRVFPSLLYRKLLETALAQQVPLETVGGPSVWRKEGPVQVDVLSPSAQVSLETNGNENDKSIVLSVRYGRRSLLLAGDIERKTERILCQAPVVLRSEILKVPHHGGHHSSSPEFLDKVQGVWAVISVGRNNRFGHPHPETIARYEERGWRILRTDRDGAVVVRWYPLGWETVGRMGR